MEGTNLELASSLASVETEVKEAFSTLSSERDSQLLAISLAVKNVVKAARANVDAKEGSDSTLSIASTGEKQQA